MNLTALQHSPFLQSLGWAIANSLWQAAALWIAYLLVSGVYRNASAKFKNNLSTILLSSAFAWFCITLFTKYFAVAGVTRIYQVEYYSPDAGTAAGFKWNELLNKFAAVLPYLSVAYLILLLFLSFRLIRVYTFTRFIKSNGLQKPAVEWKLFAEKVARHMGITRKIKLWVSRHVDVPATIGFIKPVILIPLASVNQLSADQLEAIILHELSHIKRNDYLINLFISIIETILFFNPFIVLLAKIIKRERENCCDDFVIQYQYDRHAYASALLSLEQFRNMSLRLAIGSTSGKKQLLIRVKRIMEINSNTNFNYGQKLAALLFITGVICSVAWLSPQSSENKKIQLSRKENKVFSKKAESNLKFENILFRQPDIKITAAVPAKPQPKKQSVRTVLPLRELTYLNLKQIAEQESNRWNQLLMQSRKAVTKGMLKLNRNKFFIARAGNFNAHAAFTTNGTVFSFKDMAAQQGYTAADLQKFQAEIDKAHFYFSFDNDKVQGVLKDYKDYYNMELFDQKEIMNLQEKLKDALTDKQVKTEGGKSVRIIRPGITVSSGGSSRRNLYIVDSLAAEELKLINRSRTVQAKAQGGKVVTSVEIRNAPAPGPVTHGYAYGYTTNDTHNKISNVIRVSPGSTVVYDRMVPVTPEVAERRYRETVPGNENSSKTYIRSTVPAKSIRVECKNGVVYLNGKLLDLPETNELLAQVSLKAKKVTSKIKNIDIEVND